MFRDVLENSADPAPWSGFAALGLLDLTSTGRVPECSTSPSAILATTTISPGKISLGEGSGGSATLTLRNSGSSPVTYDLTHEVAISTGTQTFGPLVNDFWFPDHTGDVQRAERDGAGRRLGDGGRHDRRRPVERRPPPDFFGFPSWWSLWRVRAVP